MAELESLVQRLELAVGRLEAVSGSGAAGPAGGSSGEVAAYVEAYDSMMCGPIEQFLSISKQIGRDVQTQAEMVKKAFDAHRQFLVTASSSQKPTATVLQALQAPVSACVTEIQTFREKNRASDLFNHLSAVSETMGALGWISVEPKPGPYVKEMQDAGTFYTNRVLKEYKEKDKKHVDWVKAFQCIWTDLQAYVKKHHTTGLVWSKTGPVASACKAAGGAPPPPPPPPADFGQAPASGDTSAGSRSELFASINKGSDITKQLKHVSDEQKTHKNPGLRAKGGAAPSKSKPSPASRAEPAAASVCASPPMLALEGKKWRVENHESAQGLEISDTELKQVVYAYKCNKSTLQVKGKINSITIDNCKKFGLVFQDVVGIVDVINSKDIKIQVLGKVPTISINKTDGCHVYLSNDSLSCEIVSAKSSEMNILVPKKDGEFEELPVPEQFKTVWDGEKLVTTVTEIGG